IMLLSVSVWSGAEGATRTRRAASRPDERRKPPPPAKTPAPRARLRLVRDAIDPEAPIPFSRRTTDRAPARGEAIATFTGPHGFAALARVRLRDTSTGGLGVRSPLPVEPGAIATLTPVQSGGAPESAIVVRCTGRAGAYHLGLRRLSAPAA
ncbi:MAG TPA: hypothetical protein PLU35_13490, partial [Phycisphaerales bacterium]|nr:hypothetical protein [Phycisphaerales bacterium]